MNINVPISEWSNAELVAHVRKCYVNQWCEELEVLLANRIEQLEKKHRWIPLDERMPTEDDGDVLLMYDGDFIEYRPWGFADKESHTHWKRIDKLG